MFLDADRRVVVDEVVDHRDVVGGRPCLIPVAGANANPDPIAAHRIVGDRDVFCVVPQHYTDQAGFRMHEVVDDGARALVVDSVHPVASGSADVMDLVADGMLVPLAIVAAVKDDACSALAVVGAVLEDVVDLVPPDTDVIAMSRDADSDRRAVVAVDFEAFDDDVVGRILPDGAACGGGPDYRCLLPVRDEANGCVDGAVDIAVDRLDVDPRRAPSPVVPGCARSAALWIVRNGASAVPSFTSLPLIDTCRRSPLRAGAAVPPTSIAALRSEANRTSQPAADTPCLFRLMGRSYLA